MRMGKKLKLLLGVLVALVLVAGWQGTYYLFHYGYSTGSRTGTIGKMEVVGPPFCKYLTGDLAVRGTTPGQKPETWKFSLDDPRPANPLFQRLHQAARQGTLITVDYRQDRPLWWRCNPAAYFVTAVEK